MSWKPPNSVLEAGFEHAAQCAPLESCGLVIDGAYHPVTNQADERDYFTMSPREYAGLQKRHGPAAAIVHSHVYHNDVASLADQASCEKFELPWLILAWPNRTYRVIEPCGFRAPLLGRPWAWGTFDCYGLVRDAYRYLAGIALPDFDREWGWWEHGENLIFEGFGHAGFAPLAPGAAFQNLDVVICQIRARVPNHCGVWLPDDMLLHQLAGRPSTREPYGGFYKDTTVLHVRHKALDGKALPEIGL